MNEVQESLLTTRQYQQSGKRWVVDPNLASFFDEVSHDLLVTRPDTSHGATTHTRARKKPPRQTNPPDNKCSNCYIYCLEGGGGACGPLSLLLSSILLDGLDRELERRGHAFCR